MPIGDPDETVPMGVQPVASLLDAIQECPRVDQGILYEPRETLGLAYRTVRSLYNQSPVLALDHDACQLGHPLEPIEDDQFTVNDITVSRSEGGSFRATEELGPISIQNPPDGVGRYDSQETVNVLSDSMLPDQAHWRLNLGTVDEIRYPLVRVKNLNPPHCPLDTSITEAAASLDPGDRLTIDNLPLWLPPDQVQALVQGHTEHLDWYEWDLRLNTSPASPFAIATVEHVDNAEFSIIQSDSASLDEALDTTETGMDIDCGGGPDWVHEIDFDIIVGGERMTVTAVGAMSGTFPARKVTLTVVRSVNGIVKTHATGAGVEFFHKVFIGL